MVAVELEEKLIDKVLTIGHYQNAQKAIDIILAEYVKTHAPEANAFDKLCVELDISDDEVDNLFGRDKDKGRSLHL